jgi:sugar phosphate isomerase/epimerase
MRLTIGCTTRPFADSPISEACRRIAQAGFSDVGLFFDTGISSESTTAEVRVTRKVAEDAGLTPSLLLAHVELQLGYEAALTRFLQLIDHAHTLGAAWLLELGLADPTLGEQYFALMRAAAPHAAAAGVGISLKPHGGLTLTVDDLVSAHGQVSHPAFGICYDPGNIIYYSKGARLPETDIDRIAPLVTTGIIKDCILRNGEPDVMITAGEGLVDFEAVLHGLVRNGFRGPLYVECVGGKTHAEIDANARRTREFVESILARA